MAPNESARNPIRYRRLPGDYRGFLRRNSLWLGEDHLLFVDSNRFAETYKRFYLRDIQTIIVRRTPRFVLPYYWVLLAAAATIMLLIGLIPGRQSLFWAAVLILAGVVLYLYIASMFQSCTCHLMTRVSRVELRSLFRTRAALRFLEVMTPQIVAAQGSLPADWIDLATTLADLTAAPERHPEVPVEPLSADQFSWISLVVFGLVLADALITWLQLRPVNSTALSTINMVNMVALAICATVAIVRLSRQKQGHTLRMLVLAGLFVVAAVTYGSVLLQSIDQQFYHRTFSRTLDYPGMRQLGIVEMIADIAVAAPGLILARRQMRGAAVPGVSFIGGTIPGTEADTRAETPKS